MVYQAAFNLVLGSNFVKHFETDMMKAFLKFIHALFWFSLVQVWINFKYFNKILIWLDSWLVWEWGHGSD